ncbi:zinc-binding metallopeptidase family protein [Xylophilus sp. ASV27]|uniref:zinc-binding metallopeptidase family protein n=1 Tax=Xylophilus sp. ASV27 TaxID=2795129 RepID=UPI0018EABA3B|nr:putative zinc-binding peptidase [Xylophilus sp. ASV27]
MKIFSCDTCRHPVFFENVQCLNCGSTLAFLPDQLNVAALQAAPSPQDASPSAPLWQRASAPEPRRTYRMCLNHDLYQACNFAVPAEDPNPLCISCRQTRVLPDLSLQANQHRWYLIEIAKRRLFYTLARLGLANTENRAQGEQGPVFAFLAEQPGGPPVMTGHQDGLITLNVAEADDDERARRRVLLREPYRTLLGHLRHESGHYYWNQLIRDAGRLAAFRQIFGDESVDYGQALQQYYASGPSGDDWQTAHVSSYATAHPWEDWAETWAHYLHMVDLLETAAAFHANLVVPGTAPMPREGVSNPFDTPETDFTQLVQQWVPVTLMLNSLNRSLGQNDAYPFALSAGALHKLRFVHDVIHDSTTRPSVDDANDTP